MYLYLGQDVVVASRDVVAIFDIENTSIAKSTKEFLAARERAKEVVNVSSELPKSFVLCCRDGETKVYISQISCATLLKRSSYVEELGARL